MSAVSLNNIIKRFGNFTAVHEMSLDIAEGSFVTLLGPSGCGKTTTLRMIAGLLDPTEGEISIKGRRMNDVPIHKRNLGLVFQNYALFPHMTIAENLAFPLQVRRMGKADAEAKVKRALSMVRLDDFGNRRPAQLSGGQQQRVAVARALVFEPELVLMDEPLGALDKNLREEMQYEIKHIHETLGVSVVYVTHDQSEALTMSNRIAVFDDGVIQQLAPPPKLYEEPDNAFVAAFIGENNKLTGRISSVNGQSCTVELDSGGTVEALAVNIAGQGEMTTLSLRPERVLINPPADKYPNTFEAKVEELIYLGDHIRTRINFAGNDQFVVKVPNAQGHAIINEGGAVRVGWAMEDCRALDA